MDADRPPERGKIDSQEPATAAHPLHRCAVRSAEASSARIPASDHEKRPPRSAARAACVRRRCSGNIEVTDERLDLGNDETSPGRARAQVAAMLLGAGWTPRAIDAVCLVLSEVITNAVRHGGGLVDARVDLDTDRVRVVVADANRALPQRHTPSPSVPTGRGVLLIDAVSDRWGIEIGPSGTAAKQVWFELRRSTSL